MVVNEEGWRREEEGLKVKERMMSDDPEINTKRIRNKKKINTKKNQT